MEKIKQTGRFNRGRAGMPIMILLMLLLIYGCDKKWPQNGNLDGQWQLQEIVDKQNKDTINPHRLYYRIQLDMVELTSLNGDPARNVIGLFGYDKEARQVRFYDFHARDYSTTGAYGEITDEQELYPYGLFGLDTYFHIIRADGKHLILESDRSKITLKSF